ncbi:hypothetical protein J4Q44_G00096430 [Coregonus suidteri]|uniref:Tudor domain-containing protein n=1 Tax=Coregonus suidteri TaxID=861788 RepID=A0AAN8MZU1_9TELE
MAECPASIVLRCEGVENKGSVATDNSALVKAYDEALQTFRSSNIEKESGEKLCDNLQKLSESESCVPSLEPVDLRANSKSCNDEKESDERVGDNPPKLMESKLIGYMEEYDLWDVSDENESDEKLADNSQKLSESCVPSKGPFDPKANLKWEVGSHCKAVWSQDGLVYPASLVWLDGECCKVKFDNYGNEEEMKLSALLPEAADQPWKEKRVWMLGSRCRAVYSEDGLVYPAVLVWMRGERCRVKFEGYGNEEELELSTLLSPDDLGGHSGRAAAKAVEGFRSTSNNSADWKKKDREWRTPQQEGREEPSSPQPPEFPPGKDYSKSSYNLGNEQGDKKKPSSRRQEPNNHPFPFFPPVPPPKGCLDFLSLLPPPPPPPCVWPPRAGLVDAGDGLDSAVTDLSSMLLSWYLCGYHTGCYMAMQQTTTSRKRAHEEKRAEE